MANAPDFRVQKGFVSPTAFAEVEQRRRQIENQQRQQEEQEKNSRFNRLITAVNTGASIVSSLMQKKEKQKEQQRVEILAQEVGKAFTPTASSSLFGTDIPIRPTPGQARQKDLAMALVRQDPDKAKDLIASQFGPQQRRAADTEIRTIEFANGTVQDVIVDKAQNKVFTLSGQEIPDEVLNKSARGFAPQLGEDLEGRLARITRSGRATTIFGEAKAPTTGKEKRIQFTPKEQKAVLRGQKDWTDFEYVKQSENILPSVATLEKMINLNPKGIRGPLQTQVSKIIAGEIGRLTDQDISRNVPLPDPPAKIREWMSQIIKGEFAEITIERYKAIMGLVLKSRADGLVEVLDDITNSVIDFDVSNANREAIRNRIGRGLLPFINKFKSKPVSPEDEATQFLQGLK